MNILIFAGGTGTRLWPLSRKASPKQFEILKDDKSTLQMAVDRVAEFGIEKIFVSTNDAYLDLVKKQLPQIAQDHILGEPAKRDLAAAIGLALLRLKKQGMSGTVAMLWSDHFMDHPDSFRDVLRQAKQLITEDSNRFIFLGERPRFANHNLGWIHLGEVIEHNLYSFKGWKYRPELKVCEDMFADGAWMWNPGYFVFDIDFVLGLYAVHMSDMYEALRAMVEGKTDVAREYPKLDAVSFDNAIVEKIDPSQAVVLKTDLGWSDPGTLYALKEALVKNEDDNFEKGNVVNLDSRDCFVFNEDPDKLVTTIGLEGMIVVNTTDALLVCHKNEVPRVKELLKKLEEEGKEKYL